MSARELTVRGVKAMLTRSGVDYSDLVITYDPAVWRDIETGIGHTSVKIEGPKDARYRAATALMFEHRLSNAPYSEYDMWCRP